MVNLRTCPQCGREVLEHEAAGRPRRYCSGVCRSAAERDRMARRLLLGALVEQRTMRDEETADD
jgi:two-component system KDP operon response regulator KdpE